MLPPTLGQSLPSGATGRAPQMALVAHTTCSGAASNAFRPRLPLGLPPFALRAGAGLCYRTDLKPKAGPGRPPAPGGASVTAPGTAGRAPPSGERVAAAAPPSARRCPDSLPELPSLPKLIHSMRSRGREPYRADHHAVAATRTAPRRRYAPRDHRCGKPPLRELPQTTLKRGYCSPPRTSSPRRRRPPPLI